MDPPQNRQPHPQLVVRAGTPDASEGASRRPPKNVLSGSLVTLRPPELEGAGARAQQVMADERRRRNAAHPCVCTLHHRLSCLSRHSLQSLLQARSPVLCRRPVDHITGGLNRFWGTLSVHCPSALVAPQVQTKQRWRGKSEQPDQPGHIRCSCRSS